MSHPQSINQRQVIQAGLIGLAELSLPDVLRLHAAAAHIERLLSHMYLPHGINRVKRLMTTAAGRGI